MKRRKFFDVSGGWEERKHDGTLMPSGGMKPKGSLLPSGLEVSAFQNLCVDLSPRPKYLKSSLGGRGALYVGSSKINISYILEARSS